MWVVKKALGLVQIYSLTWPLILRLGKDPCLPFVKIHREKRTKWSGKIYCVSSKKCKKSAGTQKDLGCPKGNFCREHLRNCLWVQGFGSKAGEGLGCDVSTAVVSRSPKHRRDRIVLLQEQGRKEAGNAWREISIFADS